MKILIVDNESKHTEKVHYLFSNDDVSVSRWDAVTYSSAQTYDLIVLSGSQVHSVVSHKNVYKEQLQLLRDGVVPIIGICAGFQLIADAFNCRLEKLTDKIQGIHRIKPLTDHEIFSSLPSEIPVYEGHRWVVKALSTELEGLANSQHGYEIIKHTTKPIYGLQFHPEVIEHNSGHVIFKNIVEILRK